MAKSAEFFSMEFPVSLNNDPAIPLAKTMEGFDHTAFAGGAGRILLPLQRGQPPAGYPGGNLERGRRAPRLLHTY